MRFLLGTADDDGRGKVKFASLHDIRRTTAQRLFDAGLTLPDVQRIMRHADPSTTLTYYATSQTQQIAQRAAGLLSGNTITNY